MRQTNIKINEHLDIESQTAEFFAKGKTTEQVPIDRYKREDITMTNRRTILETSRNKIKTEGKGHGKALRETFESSYCQRQIMAGEQ